MIPFSLARIAIRQVSQILGGLCSIAVCLLLVTSFAQAQTGSVIYTNIVMNPASGTVPAGGKIDVTISGLAKMNTSRDAVYTVALWVDGVKTSASRTCPVTFQSNGETPVNNACSFGLTASLGAGAHQLQLDSTSWEGGGDVSTQYPITINSEVPTDNASFLNGGGGGVPATVTAGQTYPVTIRVQNSGTTTWVAGGANPYRLGSQNPQDNTNWGTGRVNLSADVAPGATATFSFNVTAPRTPGKYHLQWQMVQEFVKWFGPLSTDFEVNVVTGPPVVSIGAPAQSTRIETGTTSANVTFSGTATAAPGTSIRNVEWYLVVPGTGSTLIGTTQSFTKSIPIGFQTVEFVAYDLQGNSSSVTSDFVVAPPKPTASWTLPATGSTFTYPYGTGASVRVVGSGTANGEGKLTALEIVEGSRVWYSLPIPTPGKSFSIDKEVVFTGPGPVDVHNLRIRATDNAQGVGFADATITVSKVPPTVNMSAPLDGSTAVISSGTTVAVPVTGTATANFAGSTVNKIEVLVNGASTGTPSSAGSINTTVPLRIGANKVQLRATDTSGASALSAIANVTVTAAAPSAVLTAPVSGDVFPTSGLTGAVTFKGTATAFGGATIKTLEVWEGTTKLASATASPMTATVNLDPGVHRVYFKVTDSNSQSTSTTPISFTVGGGDNAQYDSQVVPAILRTGQPATATVTMVNNGLATWPAGGLYRLGTLNPRDSRIWNNQARVYLTKDIAPGQQAVFTIPFTAPFKPGTYNFQWGMVKEGVAWFGQQTPNVVITVTDGPAPTSTLTITPTNARVSGAAAATLTVTGVGSEPGKLVTNMQLFKDSGTGYAATPVLTKTGSAASLTLSSTTTAVAGSYWYKLRVTDSTGVATESAPVFVSVTNSTLLGEVTGVRIGDDGKPALVGWVCQSGLAAGLNYEVYLDGPTAALGGTLLASGVANVATDPNSTKIQTTCATTGASHHFNVDLSPYTAVYSGRSFYVYAYVAGGTNNIVLPCADNNCTIPGTTRISLTTPANNDKYTAPGTVFMRAQISGTTGPYDEVSFSFDGGAWTAGTSDTAPNSYYLSKASVATRAAQYSVQARVRQGNSIVYSMPNMVTVGTAAAVRLERTSPVDGTIFSGGTAVPLSVTAVGSPTLVKSVQFYANDKQIATATLSGAVWSTTWLPPASGAYGVLAKGFDANGVLLAQSTRANIQYGASGAGSDTPVPIAIDLPSFSAQEAGALPGTLGVSNNGEANYSMPLVVPPGTAGLQPELALNYSSSGSNGLLGLGWGLGGMSSIHRCGKTIAQDGVNARVNFSIEDRLCLDGQRLRVVSANPKPTDAEYWADTAEFRTEIESFTRIKVQLNNGVRSYKVYKKNGQILTYGSTDNSVIKAYLGTPASGTTASPPVAKSGPLAWALDQILDRKNNFVRFSYTQDPVTGEHKPDTIKYGGNRLGAHAKVVFTYENRDDAWTRYVDEVRNDLRSRIKSIATYVVSDAAAETAEVDTASVLVRHYDFSYKKSRTSGRSLLSEVKGCARAPATANESCYTTQFGWGEPAEGKSAGFVKLGTNDGNWPGAPDMTTVGGGLRGAVHLDYFSFADFENHGYTDVLEKRVASPVPPDYGTMNGRWREATNPLPPGTLRNNYRYFHNTGTGFVTYSYRLNHGDNFAVLETGDFNGDGAPDLLVSTELHGTQICLSPLATPSGLGTNTNVPIEFNCNSGLAAIGSNSATGMPRVVDIIGDGMSSLYSAVRIKSTSSDGGDVLVADQCIQTSCVEDPEAPADVLGYQKPQQWMPNPPIFSYVSFTQMVDFAGTGKGADVRWTNPKYWAKTSNQDPTEPVGTWENLVPQVVVTAFSKVGSDRTKDTISPYSYPKMTPACNGTSCAPYAFEQPHPSASLAADFNGSGYSSLVFGFLKTGRNSDGGLRYDDAQTTLCLSTGRALDCHVRLKYSGTDYAAVRAVGNFVGDGQPSILTETIDYSSGSPSPSGNIQMCKITGDDTTNGGGKSDGNMTCVPWGGLKLPLISSAVLRDQVFFVDLLGTGRTQAVYYHAGAFDGNIWKPDGRWEVWVPVDVAKDKEALDRLVSVTNGYQSVSTVEYADGLTSGIVTHSDTNSLQYPQHAANGVGKLVSRLVLDNGGGRARSTSYSYKDPAMDVAGRGWLGFAQTISFDEQTHITTVSNYRQYWPYTGMLTSRVVSHPHPVNGSVVQLSNETYTPDIVDNFPYIKQSVVIKNDLTGDPISTTTVDSAYLDHWGNLTQQTTTTTGGGLSFKKVVDTAFYNNADTWIAGLPQTVKTTQSDAAGALDRNVSYDYDYTTGLLSQQTIEPKNTALELKTTYGRGLNSFGLVDTVTQSWTDPVSKATKTRTASKTGYDGRGRFAKTTTNALNQTDTRTFDGGTGAALSLKDKNNQQISWTYDGFGRMLAEKHQPSGSEIRYTYRYCIADSACRDANGAVAVKIKEYFNNAARTKAPEIDYVDTVGRVLRSQTWGFDGSVVIVNQSYNALGLVEEIDQPHFLTATEVSLLQTKFYDDLGRVIEIKKPSEDGRDYSTKTEYMGLKTRLTNMKDQVRVETHDALGRVTTVLDAIGGTTLFSYDQFGNLSKTEDAEHNVITVAYDKLGRKTDLKDPNLGTIHYDVDPLGRVYRQVSNAQAKDTVNKPATTVEFDDLDRMLARHETDLESFWVYDTATNGVGLLAEAYTLVKAKKNYQRLHTYNASGLPDEVKQVLADGADGIYVNKTGYDIWSRPIHQTYQRGAVKKVFDTRYNASGYVSSLERNGTVLWLVNKQDAAGKNTSVAFLNGLTQTSVFFKQTERLDNATLSSGASEKLKEAYLYDKLGNVTSRSQYWSGAGFTETFDYDDLNRIRYSQVSGQAKQEFNYSLAGNLDRPGTSSASTYTYQNAGVATGAPGTMPPLPNAVTAITGIGAFKYDFNGNMTTGNGRSYTWTSFDMPLRITKDSGPYSEFTYGPEHQRIRQTRADGTVILYAGGQEVETLGTTTTVKTYWPFGIGVDIDRGTAATELRWTHLDRLGSPIAISNEAGEIQEPLAYDAWGKRRSTDGARTTDDIDGKVDNKGFTGHEMLDQLDLVHMNGRVYDSRTGRFLSADPLVSDPMDGQNYNRYSYVLNNPTNLTDPTGFCPQGKHEATGSAICHDDLVPVEMADGSVGIYKAKDTKVVKVDTAKIIDVNGSAGVSNKMPGLSANSGFAACGQCGRFHGNGIDGGTGSLILDVIPGVSSAKSAAQLVTGTDLVTGEDTSRAMEAGGLILGMVPGGKLLTRGEKVAEVVVDAAKHEKQVESLAKGGENELARRGREAHKNYENTMGNSGYEFNKALPSGRRPDAINYEQRTVRELKPDSESGIRRGMRQLQGYVNELERVTGEAWKGLLDLYRR